MNTINSFYRISFEKLLLIIGLLVLTTLNQGVAQDINKFFDPPKILEFLGNQPMTRVGRPFEVLASISNPAKVAIQVTATLKLAEGMHLEGKAAHPIKLSPGEKITLRWTLFGDKPLYEELLLEVSDKQAILAAARFPVRFLPEMEKTKLAYMPDITPVKKNSKLLVGAHNCPLWETDSYDRWSNVTKNPERTPAFGFYAQENPEVADWETKWAVEHGVDFFIYCWYRIEQGGPVKQMLGSALHDALFNSRFKDQMKFTIMWENQTKGTSGVSNEDDLMNNLLPFWMTNYFKRANYLVVDNKPVLFIYRPEFLVDDLGSVENVRIAFDKMRKACRDAGFDGLWLLGEYRGVDAKHLELMKSIGLDYSFAYCWHVQNSPTPQQAIDSQMKSIRTTQELGIVPQVVTVSQGWSGWSDEGSIWTIPPAEFETLLRQAKGFVEKLPKNQLSGRMLLLDNWNEWGEGHYLLPYTEYGFGYLDAIRKVFTDAPEKHTDLIPEDIGMGPYETSYRKWLSDKRGK
jgi:hypothetical protein